MRPSEPLVGFRIPARQPSRCKIGRIARCRPALDPTAGLIVTTGLVRPSESHLAFSDSVPQASWASADHGLSGLMVGIQTTTHSVTCSGPGNGKARVARLWRKVRVGSTP